MFVNKGGKNAGKKKNNKKKTEPLNDKDSKTLS